MLASDADRDVALSLLREASVDGRLTLEELAERAELVSAARTRDEVAAATADLEGPATPALPDEVIRQRALFSSFTRLRSRARLVDQLKDDWRKWAERLTPPRE
jgi:hypothetical protein